MVYFTFSSKKKLLNIKFELKLKQVIKIKWKRHEKRQLSYDELSCSTQPLMKI
jgi:hypothetical protein